MVQSNGAPSSARSPENAFGDAGNLARKHSRESGQADELKRLSSHAESVSRRATGELIVKLQNGQIWEQSEQGAELRIEAGDPVTIDKGLLGAYWLWVGSPRSAIKVRRIE
jgi:hypothetical protein